MESQPVTSGRVPDVTIAQGTERGAREEMRGRAPGISVADEPYLRGIRPSIWHISKRTVSWSVLSAVIWFPSVEL